MTRKNRSQYAHPKYPNLYRFPNEPFWVFRKFSSEKGKECHLSTGIEATPQNAAAAYRVGLERFNEWLGAFAPTDSTTTFRDLARKFLEMQREDPDIADDTVRSTENQLENHMIPAFGDLKPIQITTARWITYDRAERKRPVVRRLKDGTEREFPPRTALANTRKALVQVMNLALKEGLIKDVPEFPLNDPESEPPRVIPKRDILRAIRFAGRIKAYDRGGIWMPESRHGRVPVKLLALIMWKQGARPNEVLQYQWEMIHWNEGTHGYIHIPGPITKNKKARQIPLNPQVARILRFLQPRSTSPWIFPSPVKPGERIKDYDKAWNTVMDRLGLDFTIYNLRDTFITNALNRGYSAVFIGKYCQNSASIIEKRYAVAKRDIMEGIAK